MSFSLFGVRVEITFYFVALMAFIVSLRAPANLFITILSSLLHESGHLLMMTMLGNKPRMLRFEITGINIIRQQDISISLRNELIISLGGPLFNLLVVIISCIFLCFYDNELLMSVASINLILMLFNLLPVKGLDGGLAVFCILSRHIECEMCNKILKITSAFFIALIFIWGIYVLVKSGFNVSLIIIAIFLTLSLISDNGC